MTTSIANPAATLRAAAARLLIVCLSIFGLPLCAAHAGLAHQLSVHVLPDTGEIRVDATVRVDPPESRFEFVLNAGLDLSAPSGSARRLATSDDGLRSAWRVELQTASDTLELHYTGRPLFAASRRHGDMPQGIVDASGVYLDGASAWYPQFERAFDTVYLTAKLPDGWQAVSIGRRSPAADTVTWTSESRYDDIYLIAGRFTRYTRRHGETDLSVWLLADDPALAERYLAPMGDYLDHYSRLIGAYPFAKFAVVENPWQTGFGMPSFTLLGSQVLRLPFIPYTSLPHEILHNWWGNGVWVDYARGNWSEGLTAYLADHWMQAREGKGNQYRLKALQRYSNFAAQGADLPLIDFVSRHDDATQSVGYSKSLMLFHMLRNALGDDAFVDGLRRLWRQHRFTRIGFVDAVRAIAGADDTVLDRLLPWITRAGAPRITLQDVARRRVDDGWQLELTITRQAPADLAFDLPVLVSLAGEPLAQREIVRVDRDRTTASLHFRKEPLRLDVDPEYDVMRYLDASEQPPVLSRLFGGREVWLVLPSAADPAMRTVWQALAEAWRARYPGLRVIEDAAAQGLAEDADRILLGWDNALFDGARTGFDRDGQLLDADGLRLGSRAFAAARSGVVLVVADATGVTTGFIGAATPDLVRALARKLPHYGGYGRLVFDAAGTNLVKDTLPAAHSLLSRQLGDTPVALQPPPRPVLGGPPRD